jgi:hypothetical protein
MVAITRTLILTVALGFAVVLIFWRLGIDQKQKAIDELNAMNAQLEAQVKQREEMIERLSRTRRIAHIEIADQRTAQDGVVVETDLTMIEIDENGRELGRQNFTVPGRVVFFDAWTAKFDHERIAEGHPLQGRTLVLLRRIYSDQLPPRDGRPIDLPGAIPTGYAGSEISRFEQQLWAHFWDIATDAQLAREMGVRIAQGEAVYMPVRSGQHYELIVDAAGGMSLRPLSASEITQAPNNRP